MNYLMIHKFLRKPLLLLKFLSLEAHVPESDLIFLQSGLGPVMEETQNPIVVC